MASVQLVHLLKLGVLLLADVQAGNQEDRE